MTFPTSLPQPSLRAYPFMSLIFSNFDRSGYSEYQTIAHISADAIKAMSSSCADHIDGNAPPSFVPQQAVDALIAISDETLGRLSKVIDLRIDFEKPVATKAELASECAAQDVATHEIFNDLPGTYAAEQLQAWLVAGMKGQLTVHWGALSDLYNTCEDVQKKAISDLFAGCYGFDLAALYTVQPPDITLPTELMPVIQVEQRGGYTWCFNDARKAWNREDVSQNLFYLEGRAHTNFDGHALIATAATFHEALALATAFTKGLSENPGFNRISISEREFRGTSITEMHLTADLKHTGAKTSAFKASLSWNLDMLKHGYSMESTFRSLLKIEKCVGVKWAQASRLENDLGM